MCQFASFVLTTDRVYWLPRSDSHERIICEHELNADGAREPNVVRVELQPPAHEHWQDLSQWIYKVDQDWLPEWHKADPAESEKRTRATAGLRRSIDPAWWRTMVAARAVDWTPEQRNDLLKSRANLTGANLSGANLTGANLSHANLSGANLSGANLTGANLSGANLTGANLSGTDLTGAYLTGANLSHANLSGANLTGANLYGANLTGAYLYGANLSRAYRYSDDKPIPGWKRTEAGILVRDESEAP